MNFIVSSNLNGKYVAIKAQAVVIRYSAVKFSNPILLKDEKANNCTYTNTYAKDVGTVCSPLPLCGAPTAADFIKLYLYKDTTFVVNFKSKRTSGTLLRLDNYDGSKSIGQTNANTSVITDYIIDKPGNPGYYDYKAYNICEYQDKPSKDYCLIRVYKNGQTPSICMPH
ncbi:MAG: hypothetical protein K0R94_1197 [Burkholderiales bacterium]|jgi:hypothetical protein|nr:hypothetical protein [Burkholderiales bacterium]